MKYEVRIGRLYVDEKEVDLPEDVSKILSYNHCLIVLVKPEYRDEYKWKKDWSRLKQFGNVFKIDVNGHVVGQLEDLQSAVSRLDEFWIKSNRNLDSNLYFWTTDQVNAIIYEIESLEKVESIRIEYFK
jgi:hypothetical protein